MNNSENNSSSNSQIESKQQKAVVNEKPKESVKDIVKIAKRNIEERQKRIKPSRAESILNRHNSGINLSIRDKVYGVSFGSSLLTPDENRLLIQKKKGLAQYGMLASFVAMATGLVGGFFSRRFIKAKKSTQFVVFMSLFLSSTYFQLYPILNDYTDFNNKVFEQHKPEIISYVDRHHKLYLKEQQEKKQKEEESKTSKK